MTQQVMPRREHDTPLLVSTHTGRCTAKAAVGTSAHLDKHHGAIGCLHDEVDFSTSTPRRPIIALQLLQSGFAQVRQCRFLGRIAQGLGGAGLPEEKSCH